MEIPDMVEYLVMEGIKVSMYLNDDELLCFDLNSGTKSHMYLEPSEGSWVPHWDIVGRYETIRDVSTLDQLVLAFVRFYEDGNFGSDKWIDLCCDFGYMEKVKTVQTKVVVK